MPACAAILNAWIDATAWMPRVHARDDVDLHYREHVYAWCEVTVGEVGGAVRGFLALGPHGRVHSLYLDAGARGQGLGTALVGAAKTARPEGLNLWTFLANEPARRFYARQGFVEVRRTEGENEEGLPDVLLAWPGAA
jgi:GNAT superfamily N-acetyltransferase